MYDMKDLNHLQNKIGYIAIGTLFLPGNRIGYHNTELKKQENKHWNTASAKTRGWTEVFQKTMLLQLYQLHLSS